MKLEDIVQQNLVKPIDSLAGVPFAVKNLFDIEGIVTAQLNLLKLT